MITFICHVYLHPAPSEVHRQHIFMHSPCVRSISRINVALHVIACEALLVVHLPPFTRCWHVIVLNIKAMRVTHVPVVVEFILVGVLHATSSSSGRGISTGKPMGKLHLYLPQV
jgi:hypothetical protein